MPLETPPPKCTLPTKGFLWKQKPENFRLAKTLNPNERSCRIFLEKLLGFPPAPLTPFFFCGKNFFFEIFFNEFSSKKILEFFFSMHSAVNNFENF